MCWKQRHYSVNKGPCSQGSSLPSGHAWLGGGRMPKHWCLQMVVLEKTPAVPLGSKEIRPVNLKGDQLWIFTGKTDAEAEAPVFWSSDVNSQLSGKAPDAGKDRAEGEKGDRGWVGWTASPMKWTWIWVNSGHGEGQGGLACCSSGGHRESDTIGQLNNNNILCATTLSLKQCCTYLKEYLIARKC